MTKWIDREKLLQLSIYLPSSGAEDTTLSYLLGCESISFVARAKHAQPLSTFRDCVQPTDLAAHNY